MSEIYFTSDTHWGHTNVIKYSNRPFTDVNEMNEKMLEYWNQNVKKHDVVYHLGDMAFMNQPDLSAYLNRLNGKINLILGNHDKVIVKNKAFWLAHPKISSIQHYYELKMDHQLFVLFHYGQRVWNKSHHGSIHLYGHSHGSLPPHGKSVDVGVDGKEITSEYRPIHLDEVITYMKNRTFEKVDHHGEMED